MSFCTHCSKSLVLFIAIPVFGGEHAPQPRFESTVELVSVNFSVTDSTGHYIDNLQQSDIRILDEGAEQEIASFHSPAARVEVVRQQSLYILMDTSSSMYTDFMKASDTVSQFAHDMMPESRIAVYTFSRNLFRAAPIGSTSFHRIAAVRGPILGDESAPLNALLLTLRDAEKQPGSKCVVMMSNGPDTASVVSPDDVARVAREAGIPVHVVFTKIHGSSLEAAFRRLATSTGGNIYVANTWEKQSAAFNLVRDELKNSYTLAFYARKDAREGFHHLKIEVVGDAGQQLRVHARPGYSPGRKLKMGPPCVECRLARAAEAQTASGARQSQVEGGTLVGFRLNPDPASVLLDDSPAER